MSSLLGRRLIVSCSALMSMLIFYQPSYAHLVVFSTNFDTGAPAEFSGITTTEPVQGYAGIGPASNQFGGNFLRNDTGGSPVGTPSSLTTLTLTGLPGHTSVDVRFLLAIIDTWDGSGSSPGAPIPDFFNVTLDGATIFSETFENFNLGGTQTYSPPPNVLLTPSPYPELGFFIRPGSPPDFGDSAYDMGADPAFMNIPHSASTLTISWFASGAGWQGRFGSTQSNFDESWALDNVVIELNGVAAVPEPSSFVLVGLGLVSIGVCSWWRRPTKKQIG
jgi:hypothetical protein